MFNHLTKELQSLSIEGVYSIDKISWWLIKNKEEYDTQLNFLEGLSQYVDYPKNLTKYTKESQFLDLYEVLNNVVSFYNNESYFKEQLEVYELVKNNVEQLETWLEYHKKDTQYMYEEFVSLFSDISQIMFVNIILGDKNN